MSSALLECANSPWRTRRSVLIRAAQPCVFWSSCPRAWGSLYLPNGLIGRRTSAVISSGFCFDAHTDGRNEFRGPEYVSQVIFRGMRAVGLPMTSLMVDAEE